MQLQRAWAGPERNCSRLWRPGREAKLPSRAQRAALSKRVGLWGGGWCHHRHLAMLARARGGLTLLSVRTAHRSEATVGAGRAQCEAGCVVERHLQCTRKCARKCASKCTRAAHALHMHVHAHNMSHVHVHAHAHAHVHVTCTCTCTCTEHVTYACACACVHVACGAHACSGHAGCTQWEWASQWMGGQSETMHRVAAASECRRKLSLRPAHVHACRCSCRCTYRFRCRCRCRCRCMCMCACARISTMYVCRQCICSAYAAVD